MSTGSDFAVFVPGSFQSHSGSALSFKIECDALCDDEIGVFADLILRMRPGPFSSIIGVPRGGHRLARAILGYATIDKLAPVLIVDDVLTTGASMEKERVKVDHSIVIGAVMFARGPCPSWVSPVFMLHEALQKF